MSKKSLLAFVVSFTCFTYGADVIQRPPYSRYNTSTDPLKQQQAQRKAEAEARREKIEQNKTIKQNIEIDLQNLINKIDLLLQRIEFLENDIVKLKNKISLLEHQTSITTEPDGRAGKNFTYKNIVYKNLDGKYHEVIGEIKNESSHKYKCVNFTISFYDDKNKLLDMRSFGITDFFGGLTRPFSVPFLEIPDDIKIHHKIDYDGGS